jgi:hypothetical protein
MRSIPKYARVCAFLLTTAFAATCSADTITYSNPFSDYGQVENTSCGIGGICGAAEAINSFIFLSNTYSIYKDTHITVGGAGNSSVAAVRFGFGDAGFTGYYQRHENPFSDYTSTLRDWLSLYAPGTSSVKQDTNGNNGASLVGDFIGPELRDHEDGELFIYDLTITHGHVISPTSITYDPTNPGAGGSLSYQDPNFPTVEQMVDFSLNSSGQIQFTDLASGLGTVTVQAAFSESPIPEPSTFILLASGLLAGLTQATYPSPAATRPATE